MDPRKLVRNRDFPPLLFLMAVLLWFGREMAFQGKVPFYRDLGLYFYPIGFSIAESFKNAEIPLWNRHMAMGFPLLADFQSGAFYPPNFFYHVFPFFSAVRTIFFFHYIVAATGSYALCRSWGYRPFLALMGSLLFTLGGMTVSLTNVMNHFQTAVWFPWVILASERALRSGSARDFLLFTLALLLQFLGGSPEIYLMSVGLIFLNALRSKREVSCRRLLFLPVAANILVAALAMAQLLPTLELLLESRWIAPMGYAGKPLYSLDPLSLLNLLFLDKEVSMHALKGINYFFLRNPPFFLSYYLGAVTLVGVTLWLFYGSMKEKTVLLVCIAISLTLAMGGNTPVYPFLNEYLPVIKFFRFPEKFFFVTGALLVFIALRGLHCHVEARQPSTKVLLFALAVVLGPLFAAYVFFRFDTSLLTQFIAWAIEGGAVTAAVVKKTSGVMVHLERQLTLVAAALALLFLWKWGKLRPIFFQTLIVGVVLVDLGIAHKPYQFFLDPDPIHKSPRVLPDPNGEPYRIFYYPGPGNLHPSYYTLPREPSLAEFQALVYSNLLPNTGVFYRFDYMQEIDALRRWPYVVFLSVANQIPSGNLYRLLGALNVKHIVSFRPLEGGRARLMRHFPEYPSWIYELESVVPRAYVVSGTEVLSEPVRIVGRLAAAEFDPRKKVILEKAVPTPITTGDFEGGAKILSYENQKVDVLATLNNPGILVLTDSYYPGWRAYVNGKETEILRANLFFRAVPLPAGEHLVEFKYQPFWFKVGLAVTLVAALLLFLVSFFIFFRKT